MANGAQHGQVYNVVLSLCSGAYQNDFRVGGGKVTRFMSIAVSSIAAFRIYSLRTCFDNRLSGYSINLTATSSRPLVDGYLTACDPGATI